MKKIALVVLAALFVMGVAVNSNAVMKKKGGSMRGGGMMACDGGGCGDGSCMEKLKALGLDEKQLAAVKMIHLKVKKEMIRKKADIKVAEIELMEVLAKDPVDLAAAEAAVKKTEGLKSEMKMMQIKTMEEVKTNLTPDQKKKFSSVMGMGPMCQEKGKCHKQGMADMDKPGHMQHKHN